MKDKEPEIDPAYMNPDGVKEIVLSPVLRIQKGNNYNSFFPKPEGWEDLEESGLVWSFEKGVFEQRKEVSRHE